MEQYDVIVIGAGVVGSAIARELSRYELKTAVLEKELDVATGNSSRNTGMLHGGFTYKLGTLRAQCSVEGNQESIKWLPNWVCLLREREIGCWIYRT